VTHDSDGELTRPYTGPPPTPAGPPTPPATAPQWTPPPVNPWPPQQPPPAPARGKALRWAVIGLSAIAVIAAALAVPITMHQAPSPAAGNAQSDEPSPDANTAEPPSATASAPAVRTVSSARLPELLPSASTLADLLIVKDLVQVTDGESLYTTSTTDRPDCGGAINVGLPVAYDGSGFTAIRLQEYHDVPGQTYQYGVTEAVSAFPSDQQAQAFVSTEASRWAKCKYKTVALLNDGSEAFSAIVLPPETNAGVLSASTLNKRSSGLGCQRALKAQRNIVIDVQICSPGGSAQAPSLIAQIADRIPTT
jgi:PknH-like protein